MTGHGDGSAKKSGLRALVEIRSVNNRYFKFVFRGGPEASGALESRVEGVVRQRMRRGSVTVHLRLDRDVAPENFRVNVDVLQSYVEQIQKGWPSSNVDTAALLPALVSLPGVTLEMVNDQDTLDADWEAIGPALDKALGAIDAMRTAEGQAMTVDLQSNLQEIAGHLTAIEARAPEVVAAYGGRLTERINHLLSKHDVEVQPGDLIREVGVFAERSDIAEETVRLRSHLSQFNDVMGNRESSGRKLEFLVQEMFRETNTIGAKGNDAEIARRVVEIKTSIERIREMIQNIE
ncbi:MAG: YicC family protein [Planctomycetales bacterium]|nr:YicC family protein [Planctomycetales bacterium]